MQSAVLTIQPTERGEELSWWLFHRGKFEYASAFEKKVGFTVVLTDVITVFIAVARKIDPGCQVKIHRRSGILFPEFVMHINATKFTMHAEKKFAGGSSRESVFNYTIAVVISSSEDELVGTIIDAYRHRGPKPLTVVMNNS